jgi:hypothetical protein
MKANPSSKGDEAIERVRRICLALPGTWEKISHGEPTWFAGKKVFAMFSNNHHHDGHVAVTVPAAIGIQEMLIRSRPRNFIIHRTSAVTAGSALKSIASATGS